MYRDPQTGAVGAPPAAPQRESEASTARAAAAPTDAAVPEPVQGPAGGFKVRLGAAQRAAVVRHASGGEPPMHECVSGAQGERE